MNPSTAFARVVVDELVRSGVRHVVLCPGSRSAPLAFAFANADQAGRLDLHVRIDERSAGFTALGLAKAAGHPVAVVTTSGTAVANLHPAVLEAHHCGVPLVVVSADRPPKLRGVGANQTTDHAMFGAALRSFIEFAVPHEGAGQNAYWRSAVCRAVAEATGVLTERPGPVHLNCPVDDPLVPDPATNADPGAQDAWSEQLDGREGGVAWTVFRPASPVLLDELGPGLETVILAGDCSDPRVVQAAGALADPTGWPVFAEPSSGLRDHGRVVPGYRLLLGTPVADRIERVVVIGHPTLSRSVQRLLARSDIEVVQVAPGSGAQWPDPARNAAVVLAGVPRSPGGARNQVDWAALSMVVDAAVADALADEPWPTGPAVAAGVARVAAEAGAAMVVGSSNPVRDLDLAPAVPGETYANRGLAGIDGTISTSVGIALARGGAYALMGDVTFVHDTNGLCLGPHEPRPSLRIVVVNDDGGGIFHTLEPGDPQHAATFERIFGTPHGTDLAAVCEAHGVRHTRAATAPDLDATLRAPLNGIDVVEVRIDRTRHRGLGERLQTAVTVAVAGRTLET